MSGAKQPVHQRRTTGEEEDDDIDPMVDQQGCGKVYAKLEVRENQRFPSNAALLNDKHSFCLCVLAG